MGVLCALSLASCMEKDLYQAPEEKTADEYFGFTTSSSCTVDLNYGLNYQVVFELYAENPLSEDKDGNIIKTKEEPVYRGATDKKGIFNDFISIPSYLTELYLYSDYLGTVSPIQLQITNGKVSFDQQAFIQSKRNAKGTSRGVTNSGYKYPEGFQVLGEWNEIGCPTYLSSTPTEIDGQLMYNIREVFIKPGGSAAMEDYYPEYIGDNVNIEINVKKPTEIGLVMLSSTGTKQNTVGYFTYPTDQKPTDISQVTPIIAYPRISTAVCNSSSTAGSMYTGDRVELKYWDGTKFVASDHRPIVVELRTAEKADKIFRTKPYLQNPVGNGMTVMWETTVPAYCWVEYGTDTTQLKRARTIVDGQVVCNNKLHKIRLDDLQPGQKYYYRVCSQEMLLYQAYKKVFGNTARSAFSEFTLPVTGTDSFSAVVFNDLHQHTHTFRALCRQIQDIDYDFVVFNGDCVDDPASHDQATAFISELTEGVRGDCIPTFFMRGNHEIRNAYSIGLRDHFDYVGDKTYGSFNWGDTRIVMLDCGEDKTDDHWVYYDLNDFTQLRNEQVGFLKKELAAKEFKKAKKRILLHHIPLYGNDGKNLCTELWTKLLEKAPFDICLNAHTHKYAYHPKGELGNHFPVVIGGGYKMEGATVMILEKRKEELRVRVLDAKGETLLDITV